MRHTRGSIILSLLALALLATLRFTASGVITREIATPYGEGIVSALGVLMVIAAFVSLDRLIRFFYWDGYLRRKRNRDTPALIEDILTIALVVFGASIGLSFEAGVSFTGVLTASGATAIVLGIALQTVIQDLFSGLSVNFDGSYAIGDWLTIYSDQFPEPVFGQVHGITWRTTFLHLDDGRRLMIPNRMVTSNPVLNHSRPPTPKRLSFDIVLDNRFPSERAKSILLGEAFRAVRQHGLPETPEPEIVLTKVGSDDAFYEVRFYAHPDFIRPSVAQSLIGSALHETMLRHRLPTPVTNVEMAPSPGEFEFGQKEVEDALNRVAIFKDVLNADQMHTLASTCGVRILPPGTIFIRQGDTAASMFVILEGAARITLEADGESRDVAVLVGGDIVGEMSLMTGAPRAATVTSITMMRVLEVTKDAIEEQLQASPQLLERFSGVLAARQLALSDIAQRTRQLQTVETDLLARIRQFFFG
jgi:small-conductance mechanosensitive channel/CRP-like cAMP-binding protein